MKSPVIVLVFLVLCSGLVFAAGEMTTIDFSNSTLLLVQIGKNDGVRFDWGSNNHKIVIGDVNREKPRVELTAFIEGADTPTYASLTPQTTVVFDFDRDDVKDLKVSFVKFVDKDTVILLFEKLSEPVFSPEGDLEGNLFNRIFSRGPFASAFYNLGLLIAIVIVVVVFLASSRFVRRKYRRFRRSMALR